MHSAALPSSDRSLPYTAPCESALTPCPNIRRAWQDPYPSRWRRRGSEPHPARVPVRRQGPPRLPTSHADPSVSLCGETVCFCRRPSAMHIHRWSAHRLPRLRPRPDIQVLDPHNSRSSASNRRVYSKNHVCRLCSTGPALQAAQVHRRVEPQGVGEHAPSPSTSVVIAPTSRSEYTPLLRCRNLCARGNRPWWHTRSAALRRLHLRKQDILPERTRRRDCVR